MFLEPNATRKSDIWTDGWTDQFSHRDARRHLRSVDILDTGIAQMSETYCRGTLNFKYVHTITDTHTHSHTHTHTHTHTRKVAKGRGYRYAHKYSFPSRVVDERVVCAKKHTYLHLKINMC